MHKLGFVCFIFSLVLVKWKLIWLVKWFNYSYLVASLSELLAPCFQFGVFKGRKQVFAFPVFTYICFFFFFTETFHNLCICHSSVRIWHCIVVSFFFFSIWLTGTAFACRIFHISVRYPPHNISWETLVAFSETIFHFEMQLFRMLQQSST